jgi:hypothetical protein
LLTELECIVVEPLSLIPCLFLESQTLSANGFHLLKPLLTVGFVLLHVLPLEFDRLLFQLLTTLQCFLLELGATRSKLLLLLDNLGLNLLFQGGVLLACGLQQLFALLPRLFTQFVHLTLRFLADRRIVDELLPLALGLLNNLFSLLTGRIDEFIALQQQLFCPLQFFRQNLSDGIQNINGLAFVHQTPTRKGNSAALQDNLFQLIQLIEHGEPSFAHGC